MEHKLAENIRNHRKSLGLTQEQLAERLEITLGTVSKWERGSSEPDLGYLMDLAELFHVSVDALIGFTMRGADADEEAGRIEALVTIAPFEELEAEYENALKKFPNHFRIVLGAASVCRRFGAMHHDEPHLRRALELYRHAIELISQNRDPEINETLLRNEIAGCYCELKDFKKAVEEYRRNNLSGNSNARIGLLMIRDEKKPEEGIGYTGKAFVNSFGEMTAVMCGYIHYYMQTGDTDRGIRATEWSIEYLRKSKEDPAKRSYLDKIISLFYLLQAVIRDSDGQTEKAEEDLRRAVQMARAFDADPVYTRENMIFTEHIPETVYFYDDAGPTAVEGLRGTLDEAGYMVSASFRRKFEEAIG
ncbi:MAG: helix-turn-helix transcriptional regulator [Clostridia bacterium]|nr:helix-turn-helix transcriptional regulator [Clostridia bacterium]